MFITHLGVMIAKTTFHYLSYSQQDINIIKPCFFSK